MKKFHELSGTEKASSIALLAVMFGLIFGACSSGGESSAFSMQARERFDEIAENVPEIDAIDCHDDCTSVAYIRWNQIPEDFESVMRSQAETFSSFKMNNTGTSHIDVIAMLDGEVLMRCSASKGQVDGCE